MCDNPPTSTDMCKCAKRLIRNKISLSATPTAVWIRVMLGDFNKETKELRKGASCQYASSLWDYLESNTISGQVSCIMYMYVLVQYIKNIISAATFVDIGGLGPDPDIDGISLFRR